MINKFAFVFVWFAIFLWQVDNGTAYAQDFTQGAGSTNVGCDSNSPIIQLTYDCPPNTHISHAHCSWEDRDKVSSTEIRKAEIHQTSIHCEGTINGLSSGVFGCPGGGHATLTASGACVPN